jgi:hypothetical protein
MACLEVAAKTSLTLEGGVQVQPAIQRDRPANRSGRNPAYFLDLFGIYFGNPAWRVYA